MAHIVMAYIIMACVVMDAWMPPQNIPQISWGCGSPEFSDKTEYDLFSRTVAPETAKAPAIMAIMAHYNWRTVIFNGPTVSPHILVDTSS